jgi:hypothetical protein
MKHKGDWQITRSVGMPKRIVDGFDFPMAGRGEVHYVTKTVKGPLTGSLTLTYSIEASPGTVFSACDGGTPGRLAIHFQRKGDDWSARGAYAGYRWYSTKRTVLVSGEHTTISIPLDDIWHWGAVLGTGRTQPLFDAAKARPARIGFTFGGTGNAGHGVHLLAGSARFNFTYSAG